MQCTCYVFVKVGPEPRPGSDRRQVRGRRCQGWEVHHLGQPLLNSVPRRIPRHSRRKACPRGQYFYWKLQDSIVSRVLKINSFQVVDDAWLKETFIPTVQKRGAAVIAARKLSSAMSAAKAASDHMKDWFQVLAFIILPHKLLHWMSMIISNVTVAVAGYRSVGVNGCGIRR